MREGVHHLHAQHDVGALVRRRQRVGGRDGKVEAARVRRVPALRLEDLLGGRARFFSISRSMPTANAEDPCRSEGYLKTRIAETFPMLAVRFDLALGVRRRHAPEMCQNRSALGPYPAAGRSLRVRRPWHAGA